MRTASRFAALLGATPSHIASGCITAISCSLPVVGFSFAALPPADQQAVKSDPERLWVSLGNIAQYGDQYSRQGIHPQVYTTTLNGELFKFQPLTLGED